MRSASVWRDAFALLSVRLVLAQLGLVLVIFTLFVGWLRLPDASVLEVVGSALLALLVLAAAGLGESRLILGLADRPSTFKRLLRGTLLLLAGTVLWFLWCTWLGHLSDHDSLRAGYLNSRAPHQLRYLLTFEHILLWLGWMWSAIRWMGAGWIAVFVFTGTASLRPLRAALVALRSPSYWLVLLIGTTLATVFTGMLMAWTPLHGLWPEMLSLGFRVAVAAALDAMIACWLLTILAACVRYGDSLDPASVGGPDDSQPRTVEAP